MRHPAYDYEIDIPFLEQRHRRLVLRKRWMILLILLFVTGLSVIAWQVFARLEPVYEGKPIGFWLQSYDPMARLTPDSIAWRKADKAMRHFGSKAIPALLRRLRAHDSVLKSRLIVLAQKQAIIKIDHVPPARLHVEGFEGFKALGDMGAEAVPELIGIVDQNVSLSSQCYSIGALGYLGAGSTNAIPSLLRWLTNTNVSIRWNAALSLGRIHAEPKVVVPALVRLLRPN